MASQISRYAQGWAFYLGMQWGYQRELGEPQLTFNYNRALSDYTTNFCFGKGVFWTVPKENEAVIPPIIDRIWETDNDRLKLLWEFGQTGSVCGDVFAKVAYEEPWTDPAGGIHPGRLRILPLNPAFCYPEWHPHDRSRMIRFKLKYKFWGTTLEGTRSVFTYTELITDESISEYINDELVDSHQNYLGMIPIVHCVNLIASSSPWGLPDFTGDFISLARQYNETSTALADIINYHAMPTTVVTGGKANNLEKGAKKTWSIPSEKAKVFNLEMASDAELAQAFLDRLKQAMFEMASVPISALGQEQAVSNTSGVALQIQFQPMMMRFGQKSTTYGPFLEEINYLALKTLALKEPELFVYDPTMGPALKDGQLPILDKRDPNTYRTKAKFQTSLPIDKLIILNELMAKMGLGLESKRGALRELGEEHPDEKLEELIAELFQDAKDQGALDLLRAQIMDVIQLTTFSGAGMVEGQPDSGSGGNVASAGGPDVNSAPGAPSTDTGSKGALPGAKPVMGADLKNLYNQLTTAANGTQLPQRRMPDNDDED